MRTLTFYHTNKCKNRHMTQEEKDQIKAYLIDQHEQDVARAEGSLELAAIRGEFRKKMEKLEQGINPLDKPDNTPYFCEGCGS